jgi:sugar/nucleoside kinase (ribokinase family)
MFDLYCLGGISVDLVVNAPRLPLEGEKLIVSQAGRLAGGFIANTACAAARLGLHTAWSGYVGDDDFGQTIMRDFDDFGVDIHDIIVHKDSGTSYTIILLLPNGERTILVVPTLPSPPPVNRYILKSLRSSRMAYTAFYEPDWFTQIAQTIHAAGGKIAVDMEVNTLDNIDSINNLLPQTDIIFTNEEGLRLTTAGRSLDDCVNKLFQIGLEMVVITNGKKGASVYTPSCHCSTEARDVPVIDTTGAGDCFHAAFLFGVLSNWDLQYSLDFASASAALLIQSVGARTGLPTLSQVNEFIKTHSL